MSSGHRCGGWCSSTRPLCIKIDPTTSAHGNFYRYVCLIESIGRTTGLRQMFTHVEGQERPLQMGWETAVKGPGPGPFRAGRREQ